MSSSDPRITLEVRGHLALIGIHRPEKRNAFDVGMLRGLSFAVTEADRHPDVRCMVIFAVGDHFSAGLDLASVAPALSSGEPLYAEGFIDPWGIQGAQRTKPLVVAVQGLCLTLSIELILTADIAVASEDARFGQIEIKRGIFPFGGATLRFPQISGWGNAMRWLLTGDEFDAAEALRIGLVQEVVEPGNQRDRAVDLAERIATRSAPLAVGTTLAAAQRAIREGERAAEDRFVDDVVALFKTQDGAEGMLSFIERRPAR